MNTKMRWTGELSKKVVTQPWHIWAFNGAVALAIVFAWFMLMPAQQEAPPISSISGAPRIKGIPTRHLLASAAPPVTKATEKQLDFIQSVRFHPSQPTRMDRLKAEIELISDAPKELAYTYLWKVNDRIIKEAKGNTLDLSSYKKRDMITVTIIPSYGNIDGFAVEGPVIAVHSIPPSLELKARRKTRITKEPIELQLVGITPDGGQLTFSLESPYVPGMTIDDRSGTISWRQQPGQKGTMRFGAAVEDDDRTKVTKYFDITVE